MDMLPLFRECGALLEGHFVLSSGLHSNRYLQCAKVLQYPAHAAACGAGIAALFQDTPIDVVVGPAMGGVIIAHEVGRALQKRALFTERENGEMTLRRGFVLQPGERVLVVEDVVTTGGSAQEVARMLTEHGVRVAGVAAIVDRSNGRATFDVPFRALLTLEVATYAQGECPLCAQGMPLVKPGSKGLK
ncbi:MAG: orotate phosphoribosyltransferase [bacterium]|nr:orotate phosphoribosyltransferase [bacterium]